MEKNYEGIGATEFDLPDSQNPEPHAPIYHTKTKVPHPTNTAAKMCDGAKIMRQVLYGK